MQFARTFSVPESELYVANWICDYMSQIGYRGGGNHDALSFQRGSFPKMLSSLTPRNAPSKATVCVEAEERETRVSAVIDVKLLPPYTEGERAYFEAELDGLEQAAWGNGSSTEKVEAALRRATGQGKSLLKDMVGTPLIQILACLSALLMYAGLSMMVDGRYLLMATFAILPAYYAQRQLSIRTDSRPGRISSRGRARAAQNVDSLKRRMVVGFLFVAAWLPFAPNSALFIAAILGMLLLAFPWMSNGRFVTLMVGVAFTMLLSSTNENPNLWGVNLPSIALPQPGKATNIAPSLTARPAEDAAAIEAAVAELEKKAIRVQTLSAGSLVYSSSDIIETKTLANRLRDFIIETRFLNPYSREEGSWDYGFMFRELGFDSQYRIFVDSNRGWAFNLSESGEGSVPKTQRIGAGVISDLDTSPAGSNRLRLVVNGDTGYWFVNGKYVARLNVSQVSDPGWIRVGTGFYRGNRIERRQAKFEDFALWAIVTPGEATATAVAAARPTATRIPQPRPTPTSTSLAQAAVTARAAAAALSEKAKIVYGPVGGSLAHADDGVLHSSSAPVTLRDFIAEARFRNPYDKSEFGSDSGFAFRSRPDGSGYRLHIDSGGAWTLELLATPNTQQPIRIASGPVVGLDTSATGSNTLKVVGVRDSGFFFVNEKYVATLNLSRHVEPGQVAAAIGFDQYRQLPGKSTNFEGFTVSSLD